MANKRPNDKQPNDDQHLVFYFQIATGVIAALMLAFGGWGYLAGSDDVFIVGMAVRLGATLGVISLAMPQLAVLRRRMPSIAIAFGLVALLLISTRGNVGRILLGILAAALAANAVLAWLANLSGKK